MVKFGRRVHASLYKKSGSQRSNGPRKGRR